MKKLIYSLIGSMILLIPLVSADVILPFYMNAILLMPFILLILGIETISFWLLNKKILKSEISFLKIFIVVILANIASSLFGLYILSNSYSSSSGVFPFFIIAFILTTIIEYPVYALLFIKDKISKLDLFLICAIVNAFGYIAIVGISAIGFI
ncbi:MAG: hypothetical protein ABH804_00195 [archaeon]